MKALLPALAAAGLLSLAGTASATTAWKPGSPYYASEREMNVYLMEEAVDFANCDGITRFGRRTSPSGEYKYNTFDCTLRRDDIWCQGSRYMAVKLKTPKRWKVVLMRKGRCH